ncbi:hypothetical protein JAAARDRAFT_31768 [Jaapia argillacea MUCL 33604]|uniref:Pkinase-domain-containing protein n=1 Tax=Jaapia argillacea MUCL 33604 TaxID=933084 RepID=A0A067QDX0_9AGAM|nr:hypothetical protein JAAARDRAFT_31768 [Jaapia argillacea MUCL 33604]
MSAITASGSYHAFDDPSMPASQSSSPSSPTFFPYQQTLPPYSAINPNSSIRTVPSSSRPGTPTSVDGSGLLDPPHGVTFPDFIRTWSDTHVSRWLADIKCERHATTFRINDIRGDVLLEMDHSTLKEMGVASIGDRLRIVNAVKTLRQKCSSRGSAGTRLRMSMIASSADGDTSFKYAGADSSSPSRASIRREHPRPAPLNLPSNGGRGDLPRLIRDPTPPSDPAKPIRSLPRPPGSSESPSTTSGNHTPNATGSSPRPNLPPAPPVPRGQPPLPPNLNRNNSRNLYPATSLLGGRKTPTQIEVPSYVNQPLPPAPQTVQTPVTATWGGYGLPTDPRPGNLGGGKTPTQNRSMSPLQNVPGRGSSLTQTPAAQHGRNTSLPGANLANPLQTPSRAGNAPSGNHPYASSQNQALPVPQHLTNALSPVAESFMSQSSSLSSTPSSQTLPAYTVGRGPFNRPHTPSHGAQPSLDDLRRRLVKFTLPDEGHSCTINVADCAGGIEVLEKALKKFGKLGSRRSDSESILDNVTTDGGGLSVDGWGVFLDWGLGPDSTTSLTEAELLAVCHAPPDDPARERGLTLRRTGKSKRSKFLPGIFGESPPVPGQAGSPTSPLFVGPKLSTGEEDQDGNLLSPNRATSFAAAQAQTAPNTKRASSISILSGLGVRDPEKALEPPSPSKKSSPPPAPTPAKKVPSKLRNFFGQRPPSELITNHLPEYFPFTEKKVLERTARNSMMRANGLLGFSKRDSAMSFAAPSHPRFSVSTLPNQSRRSFSPSRASVSSMPPPVPEKPSAYLSTETLAVADQPPRVSLSTDDGHSVELKGEDSEDESVPRWGTKPHLLPPVTFPSESLVDSMEVLTSSGATPKPARPVSRRTSGMSHMSKRMSYITELRSRRDVSDTASMVTVDEITAEVESRREGSADISDDWTEVESDDEDTRTDVPSELDEHSEDDYEDDTDEDETEEEEDDEESVEEGMLSEEDETGKAMTSNGLRRIKWIKGALIGAGSFGKVYLGMDSGSGLLMAVKQVELPKGTAPNEERKKSMLTALEREIELLKTLQHENIVQYLDSSTDDEFLNIFLEYVPGGSVTALLRNYGAFEEPLVKNFVRQILQGLNYLHEREIVHRDIKGANILVDNKGGIKISDFGISKKVEDNLLGGNRAHRPSLQGSVFWMAPEVVKQTAHTVKADIWSVGCLIVEMLTGEHPYPLLTQMQAIFKIGSSAKPTIPPDISMEAEDFLTKTFETNHEARPTAGQLLDHPWIAQKSHNANMKPTLTVEHVS